MAAKKKVKKYSKTELVRRLIICDEKIEKLRRYYKRKDNIVKQLLPIVFDKGKYNDDDESYTLKIGKNKVKVAPNCFDKDGNYVVTQFRACGIPVFNITLE